MTARGDISNEILMFPIDQLRIGSKMKGILFSKGKRIIRDILPLEKIALHQIKIDMEKLLLNSFLSWKVKNAKR